MHSLAQPKRKIQPTVSSLKKKTIMELLHEAEKVVRILGDWGKNRNSWQKKLFDRELNPGLPRDRRRY
jgi:hypothetical protein